MSGIFLRIASSKHLAMQGLVNRQPTTVNRMISSATVPHFDIPLDLPHAGRIADRILVIVQRHAEEKGVEAAEAIDAAERLWSLLFRYSGEDDNPADAMTIRDEAAAIGREIVDAVVAVHITSDRLGQLVRNLFGAIDRRYVDWFASHLK